MTSREKSDSSRGLRANSLDRCSRYLKLDAQKANLLAGNPEYRGTAHAARHSYKLA
ncbi:MAG: hypothetical protein AB4426_22910 [Xenococcaceae cyanobacterium]